MYIIKMIIPSNKDILHKTQLFRLLKSILQNPELSSKIAFKGGTYAALRGVLNRFSVDLDFDLIHVKDKEYVNKACLEIIQDLGLEIKDRSKEHLQFFLRYNAPDNQRNTLKLEINDQPSKYNKYESIGLNEINIVCTGHTLDTMFANKLYAAMARHEKTKRVAGRDFFDIHQFFYQSIPINKDVIEDKTGLSYTKYMMLLKDFVLKEINNDILVQDLNPLLSQETMKHTLPHIKEEIIMYIDNEIMQD
jgi:predicted nucleotidyltransferase component of viral defense system